MPKGYYDRLIRCYRLHCNVLQYITIIQYFKHPARILFRGTAFFSAPAGKTNDSGFMILPVDSLQYRLLLQPEIFIGTSIFSGYYTQ